MTYYFKAYSFLEVTRGTQGKASQKFYTVLYAGNMGASMSKVAACFEALYGKGTFAQAEQVAKDQSGSPDYCWTMRVPAKAFERIVGKNL